MPTLEAYKKLAKQLVRWHREGNYSIGERIRRLDRYRLVTDKEALALKFPLSEAQEIIAIEAGHKTWAELKRNLEAVPSDSAPSPGAALLKSAFPVLFVANVKASAEFFRDLLGFKIDFLHGHPAFYGAVSRDGATIHLRFVHEPVFKEGARQSEQLIACFLQVENVKSLYAEYMAKGVTFDDKLKREAWGGTTFSVPDLDGNSICFSG